MAEGDKPPRGLTVKRPPRIFWSLSLAEILEIFGSLDFQLGNPN